MKKQTKDVLVLVAFAYLGYMIGVVICRYFWHNEAINEIINDIMHTFLWSINIFIRIIRILDPNTCVNILIAIGTVTTAIFACKSYKQTAELHAQTVEDERKLKTIKTVNEIDNKYDGRPSKEQYQDYLNDWESLALGIKLDVYKIDVVYYADAKIMIEEYKKWAQKYIIECRKAYPEHIYLWNEYESMIHKLQEMWENDEANKKMSKQS